jgi:hypothetical protein
LIAWPPSVTALVLRPHRLAGLVTLHERHVDPTGGGVRCVRGLLVTRICRSAADTRDRTDPGRVLVAEIGDVTRFPGPEQFAC